MNVLLRDVRFALRLLRKSPGFTLVAVLTLAIGIGANAAIFSVVHAVLLRPLPYDQPDRLTLIWNRMVNTGSETVPVAAPDAAEFRESARSFQAIAFTNRISDAALTGGDRPEHIALGMVTQNFFDVLGVRPRIGREFEPEEGLFPPGVDPDSVVLPPSPLIISDGLWKRRYGAEPNIIGARVEVNGDPGVVVGVLPPGFELLIPPEAGLVGDVDAWTPLPFRLSDFRRPERLQDRDSDNTGAVIGRLAPGVSLGQAQAEMDAIAASQRERYPFHREAGTRIDVYPMHDDVVAHARPLLMALLTVVGAVLLVACINIANLMLARSAGRRQEMAVRSALGAGRVRLARQVITESLALAAAGGLSAILLARWGMDALLTLQPEGLPRLEGVGLSLPVLAATLGATLLAAVIFGAAPAVNSSGVRSRELLRERSSTGGDTRFRSGLVVVQVALSLALLIVAGLMLKSFERLQRVDPGFDPEGVMAFSVSLRYGDEFRGPAATARFARQLEDGIQNLPGVESAGLVGRLPLGGRVWTQPYALGAGGIETAGGNEANFRVISSGYFPAMGIRLLSGRNFVAEDDRQDVRVAIVDETLARQIAPDGAAIGQVIGFPLDGDWVSAEVVGVVESVRQTSLREPSRETLYVPYRHETSRDVSFVVRSGIGPGALVPSIRRQIAELGVELPIYNVQMMEQLISESLAPSRFALLLMTAFAAVAVVLALVGVYGVIAYSVSERIREFGVRIALGARPQDLVLHVLRHGMFIVAIGLAIGIVLSTAGASAMGSLLFQVDPIDPTVYAALVSILGLVAALASYVPARRASRIEPMAALRRE